MTRHHSKSTADRSLRQALEAHQRGLLPQAEAGYRRVIDGQPGNGDARNLYGVLLHQSGRNDEARAHLELATQLLPAFADAFSNLGMVQLALGNNREALAALNRAIELSPQHWNARGMRSEALLRSGALREAEQDLLASLTTKPDWRDGWCRLALVRGKLDAHEGAASAWWKAIALDPCNDSLYLSIGISLRKSANFSDAVDYLEKALQLAPDKPEICGQLAWALFECGQLVRARTMFDAAMKKPGNATGRQSALIGLGNTLVGLGLPDDAIRCFREAKSMDPEGYDTYSPLFAALSYSSLSTGDELLEEHASWASRLPTSVSPGLMTRHAAPWRIGLLSADLRNHAVARFIGSWLGKGNADEYQYVAYSFAESEDDVSAYLKARFTEWRSVGNLKSEELRSLFRDDRIDILIDLAGHTYPNRLECLATKVVPVQAAWLGYPETTGLDTIDYRITDETCDPVHEAKRSVEAFARLPSGFMAYSPIGEEREARIFDVPHQAFVFGCFNNIAKINPEVFRAFAKILSHCNNAMLMLKHFALNNDANREWLKSRFVDVGISQDRLLLMPTEASLKSHLETYNQIDLALDTFPYNGTTTTCEALWMGVPVLTLRGNRHAGRVGASIVRRTFEVESSHWIAENLAEYIEKAARASQAGKRSAVERHELRNRFETSGTMDGKTFAGELEAEFSRWISRSRNAQEEK